MKEGMTVSEFTLFPATSGPATRRPAQQEEPCKERLLIPGTSSPIRGLAAADALLGDLQKRKQKETHRAQSPFLCDAPPRVVWRFVLLDARSAKNAALRTGGIMYLGTLVVVMVVSLASQKPFFRAGLDAGLPAACPPPTLPTDVADLYSTLGRSENYRRPLFIAYTPPGPGLVGTISYCTHLYDLTSRLVFGQ